MKKLICSLMVVTMMLNIVPTIVRASLDDNGEEKELDCVLLSDDEINASCSEDDNEKIDQPSSKRRGRVYGDSEDHSQPRSKRRKITFADFDKNLNKFLNDEKKRTFEDFKKILDKYKFNEKAVKAVTLKIYLTRGDIHPIKPEDIVDTVFYLESNGVKIENKENGGLFNNWDNIRLALPGKLNKEESIGKTMFTIANFCYRYGTICVLASGDVISSDGKIYDCDGNEYNEYGVTEEGKFYADKNDFRLNSSLGVTCGNTIRDLDPYGIFLLSTGEGFSCYFGGEEQVNKFINLEEVESMSNENGKTIKIGKDETVTFSNGLKISTEKKEEPITDEVKAVLKEGLSQVVFNLLCERDGCAYIEYVMKHLPRIDENVREWFGNVENLRNFVLENFCQKSLFIAIQYLEFWYGLGYISKN